MVTMKQSVGRAIASTTLVVYALGIAAPAIASAATPTANPNSSGQALEIAPPVITLGINPGQTVKTQVLLRDVSPTNVIVTGEVNDFVAAGEDGTPKILLKDEGSNPYSLKGWITPPAQLLLAPRQVKSLPITVSVPANASPGGHYGIIRFTATAPQLSGTGVSLSASLGALMLITVNGKTKESLSVKQFSTTNKGKVHKLFESAPVNFLVRLQNQGNIHEQPVGLITVKDMFGKKTAQVPINQPPRNVLPQSIRKFESPLDSTVIGNKKLFGHYSASLKITYGASKQVTTASLGFWVIPYRLIFFIIVILVGGFFAFRFFIRRYNRAVITRAQGSSRKK